MSGRRKPPLRCAAGECWYPQRCARSGACLELQIGDRPDREVAARAIYDRRPFRMTSSGSVMDPLSSTMQEFSWDDAPVFYQTECYELADAVLAALSLNDLREQRPLPTAEAA